MGSNQEIRLAFESAFDAIAFKIGIAFTIANLYMHKNIFLRDENPPKKRIGNIATRGACLSFAHFRKGLFRASVRIHHAYTSVDANMQLEFAPHTCRPF